MLRIHSSNERYVSHKWSENMIKQSGYPFELHHATTRDGYILALHRIPNRFDKTTENRRVVLIMHGLLGSSADWILTGQNRSIAYLLADNGYDVWLGNSRGTTNSKNHTTLSIQSAEFWNFSWHEMGIYDLPAIIDYILHETGQKQLFYIGFSQGTTQFWILTSLRPEYNQKIKLMSALAPVAYTGHVEGLLRPASFIANKFKVFYPYIGFFEMLANTEMEKFITYTFCRENTATQPFCELIVSMIGGFSVNETDHTHFADYLQYTPAGCSYKQLIHYAFGIQNPGIIPVEFNFQLRACIKMLPRPICVISQSYPASLVGHFRPYDYGMLKNVLLYGQFVPPEYPVEKITAPVMLYNGLNDFLANPNDVELLNQKLPNVLEKYTVTVKRISHFDFVFGLHIRDLVYNRVIEKMNAIP
ncbi:hypothetical protein PUN28_010077 [Cardiocondyla obscurior]|uniref:Lipase n=1 Tax=Cardiocondyla obscurior TaxID=286306 RepID=A0AAW2FNC5_9HYME